MADNEIGKELEESTESPAEKVARRKQELQIAEQQLETIKGQNASLVEQAKLKEQIADLVHKENEAIQAQARHAELVLASELEALKAREKAGEYLHVSIEDKKEELRLAKELNDARQKELDIAERQAAIDKKRDKFAEGFVKRWTGLEEGPGDSLIGNMIFDAEGTIGSLGKEFTKLANPLNITKNLSLKVAEATMALAIEQDAAVVNFRKATGASGEFDDNIRGLERSLFTAGVGAAEAGQAVQTLFLNVTDFTEMSETQQETLGKTVAVLNELGVASETTAKNIQFATKVMGLGTNQAAELQRELFTFAQELGVSADKMASDFASMGPQIAALGSNGVDAFKKLEVQAKNTGLALTEILGIVEKFDKFDSAAESVGKLNALLGGPYLNTLELVAETDPSERFKILKERVDDAGLSFDTMDYYQKKAMASAMGLNEQQLALMMRGRLDLIKEPTKSAEDIEALAEQTKNFNTLMEEMTQVAKMLAISFGPLVKGLKLILQAIQAMPNWLAVASAAILVMAMAYKNLTIAQAAAFGPLIAGATVAYAVYQLGIMFGLAEEKAAALAIVIGGALTLALLTFSGALALSTGGLSVILAALSMLAVGIMVGFSPSVLFAIGALTTALFLLAPAIWALMPALLPLALGLGAIALAAVGLTAAFASIFGEGMVTNLQLMSVEIANIIDKINELSATKAVAFTATMASVATAATVAPVAASALLAGTTEAAIKGTTPATTPGPTAPVAPAAAPAFTGPPPTINVNLSIDGKEFATVVNSVDVSKYTGGKSSNLYDSVIKMIKEGFEA